MPCSEAGTSVVTYLSTVPFPLDKDREAQIPHEEKKKNNIRFSQEQRSILFLQLERISLVSGSLCLDSGSNSGEVSALC